VGDRIAKDALFGEFAAVGKVLGSPRRLELIDLLAQSPRSVEDLARAADLGLSTCSAHLQTLRVAGLVETRRNGTRIFYSLASRDVAALFANLR
jgi:DNA-binding transcriptional ArsR family regulator